MVQRWRRFVGSDAPGYRKRKQNARSNALLGLFGGFLAVYMVSEFVLASRMHPIHWLGAVVGAVVIYFVTYLWLLRRSYTRQIKKNILGTNL